MQLLNPMKLLPTTMCNKNIQDNLEGIDFKIWPMKVIDAK